MRVIVRNTISWDMQVECHRNERGIYQSAVAGVYKTCKYNTLMYHLIKMVLHIDNIQNKQSRLYKESS